MPTPIYKRILVKISGEALKNNCQTDILDFDFMDKVVASVKKCLDAGVQVASSFKSQWKHEQYSVLYYDSQKWYDALVEAENFDWKGAMDIWITLLDSKDQMKRSCAEYNISVACYMLGDYPLAIEWLDLSDKTNKLPISDAMRKRILSRKK